MFIFILHLKRLNEICHYLLIGGQSGGLRRLTVSLLLTTDYGELCLRPNRHFERQTDKHRRLHERETRKRQACGTPGKNGPRPSKDGCKPDRTRTSGGIGGSTRASLR